MNSLYTSRQSSYTSNSGFKKSNSGFKKSKSTKLPQTLDADIEVFAPSIFQKIIDASRGINITQSLNLINNFSERRSYEGDEENLFF